MTDYSPTVAHAQQDIHFRLYFLGRGVEIKAVEEFTAGDRDEGIVAAQRLAGKRTAELWSDAFLLARIVDGEVVWRRP